MIRLFSSNDKVFTSNGDKVITPLKAKIHKEDDGSFYLDLETSLDYVEDITANRIIVANTPQGEQAFRITNVEQTRKKISYAKFRRKSYSNRGSFACNNGR